MSNCTEASSRAMAALSRRVDKLEAQPRFTQEITGICTKSPELIVDIIANVRDPDTGVFTITWSSIPGQSFQVQTSTDAVTWTVAANVVNAAASPAIMTEWESEPVELDDLPVYFRIRRHPSVTVPCTPPEDPCPNII